MTNLVPHDIEEWMRTMERRYVDLASRRVNQTALAQSTPRWRSKLSSVLATTNNTVHWLAFDTAASSPDHDPATTSNDFFVYSASSGQHRYTAQAAGLYYVAASVQWQANGTGMRKHHITRNNTGDAVPLHTLEVPGSAAGDNRVTVHGPVALAAGDWFRIAAYQSSGGNLNINNSDDSTGTAGGRAASYLTIFPIGAYLP